MREEKRRVAMGVTNGVQQWLIEYTDGSSEYKYLNLYNNQWSDSNTADGTPDKTPADDTPDPNPNPDTGTGTGLNWDTFRFLMSRYLFLDESSPIIQEFWNAYETKFKDMPGVTLADIPNLIIGTGLSPTFDKEYAAYIAIRKDVNNVTGITSLAEFNQARAEYKNLLSMYGLRDLATNENIDKFLTGNISVAEANARLSTAFEAIQNADSLLRQQLGSLNLSDADLARALLLGKDGAVALQDKIKVANIKAGEVQAGLKSVIGAEELARQGVSRQQAASGLATTKNQVGGYAAEAVRQGEMVGDLQKELESENILGLASQRRKRIQQRAVARFSGKSGAISQSLAKKTTGTI
jgi:hypothetical protein